MRLRIPGFDCSRSGPPWPEGKQVWFRVFGFGFYAKNVRSSLYTRMSFAEKNGLVNFVIIRGWLIRFRYPFGGKHL